MVAYRKWMAKFPLKLPSGPQDELCTLYEGLRLDVVVPPKWAQLHNSWISAPTWGFIYRKAVLQHQRKLSKQMSQFLVSKLHQVLKGTGDSMLPT